MFRQFPTVKPWALVTIVLAVVCTALFAGHDREVTQEELHLAWADLLDLALSGDEDSREGLERVKQSGAHLALRTLADFLLAEWDVAKSDERFGQASLVWLPEIDYENLPPYAKEISAPGLVISGIVTPEGRLEKIELVRSSGSALIDQAALDNAKRALYRPASADGVYQESHVAIKIHLDPR